MWQNFITTGRVWSLSKLWLFRNFLTMINFFHSAHFQTNKMLCHERTISSLISVKDTNTAGTLYEYHTALLCSLSDIPGVRFHQKMNFTGSKPSSWQELSLWRGTSLLELWGSQKSNQQVAWLESKKKEGGGMLRPWVVLGACSLNKLRDLEQIT